MFNQLKQILVQMVSTPSGKVSHSKVWSNIGFLVSTFVVVWQTVHATLTVEMMLVYIGAVVTNTNASKLLSNKQQGAKDVGDDSK